MANFPSNYHNCGVNSTPVSGRYLAHNRHDPVAHAFLAADLYAGAKKLTDPTMVQSAYLARVNVTYGWWAHRRQDQRADIEAGRVPLVPPSYRSNGSALVVPHAAEIGDSELVAFVRAVGVNRVLEAAVTADAAQ